jgi:hypothetical protein
LGKAGKVPARSATALPTPTSFAETISYQIEDVTIAAGGAASVGAGSGAVIIYSAPATSMTAVIANANMAKIKSRKSSICLPGHSHRFDSGAAAIAFGYPRERS